MLLHFKHSKSGQILHVDKTCFPRLGHICAYALYIFEKDLITFYKNAETIIASIILKFFQHGYLNNLLHKYGLQNKNKLGMHLIITRYTLILVIFMISMCIVFIYCSNYCKY